jgi:diguanylate cyclase (GGDEF)-like protein
MQSERSTDAFRTLEARARDPERRGEPDALTGLHGAAWFDDKLEERLSGKHDVRAPLNLMLADIDGLAAIVESHGSDAGDKVIAAVGAFLRMRLRYRDLLARHGDASFAILLSQGPAAAGPVVAERLRAAVADHKHDVADAAARVPDVRVTVSVGCVTIERGGSLTRDEVMQAATRALAAAKRDGHDRVVTIDGSHVCNV